MWTVLAFKSCKNSPSKIHKNVLVDATIAANEVVLDEFDSDVEETPKAADPTPMPVFDSIRNHVVSPFIQITDSINYDSE